jgi:hypothetical protein
VGLTLLLTCDTGVIEGVPTETFLILQFHDGEVGVVTVELKPGCGLEFLPYQLIDVFGDLTGFMFGVADTTNWSGAVVVDL